MKLTVVQQAELMRLGSIGCSVETALLCLGFSPKELSELARDDAILALHRAGVAEGARDIRAVMAREASAGNVSAAKLLAVGGPERQHDDGEVPRRDGDGISSARWRAMVADLRRRFQRMRELQESDA